MTDFKNIKFTKPISIDIDAYCPTVNGTKQFKKKLLNISDEKSISKLSKIDEKLESKIASKKNKIYNPILKKQEYDNKMYYSISVIDNKRLINNHTHINASLNIIGYTETDTDIFVRVSLTDIEDLEQLEDIDLWSD